MDDDLFPIGNNSSEPTNGLCEFFTTPQCKRASTIRAVMAAFSALGCLFIILMILIHRTYRNFGQRLVLSLTVAGFAEALVSFMTDNPELPATTTCKAQGFLLQWLDMSVLVWVCAITHSLYINVLREESAEKYEKWYHIFGWLLGFLVALIPTFTNDYGPAGAWCWIEGRETKQHVLRFVLWYGPLYIVILGLFVANGFILLKVYNQGKTYEGTFSPEVEAKKKFMVDLVQPLKLYPVVYLLVSIFPISNRIQNAANEENPVYWLTMAQIVCNPLQGVMNALVYAAYTDDAIWKQCTPTGICQSIRRAYYTRNTMAGGFTINGDAMSETMVDSDIDSDDDEDLDTNA